MVRHGDGLGALAVEQVGKPGVAQLAAGHLERFAGLVAARCDVEILDVQVYAEAVGQGLNVVHVAVRLLAAEVEIAVRGGAPIAQLQQYVEEGHRVGAPAHCHYHRRIGPQEPVRGYV